MPTIVSILATRLKKLDDDQAWEEFDRHFRPLLKRYFNKFGYRDESAEDLVQDTVRRVAEGLQKQVYMRFKGRFRHWVRGIARNVLRNHLRKSHPTTNADQIKSRFWEGWEDPDGTDGLSDADRRFDAIWIRSRLSALIRQAAGVFELRTLHCYMLVDVRRLPIKEVARRTRLSESAVYNKRRQVANWFLAVAPRFVSRLEQ